MRCLVLLALLPCLAGARDWQKYPAIVERPAPATLYAIGDIHGDYERMIRLMTTAHIIAGSDLHWAAASAMLVITGDMIDKGPRSVDVLLFLKNLRASAPNSGGEVILLAGNHEAEFLASPGEKKAADFIASLKSAGISAADVGACKGEIGEFLCTLPFGARIGDTFFSHAGDPGGMNAAQLGAAIESGFAKNGFAAKELIGETSLLEARLPDPTGKKMLEAQAAGMGVKRIVEGHQPKAVKFVDGVERHAGEMFQRWGVRYLIDTGMSRGVGESEGAALRISGGKVTAICANGTETLLWSEAQNQDTGRATACRN